ncbi:Biotin-requiring enzyme [Asanoa hainanensis]|uniref:Biotin-requiring enzyme n=1 Tax=Asanoa hainanensis TaxID=560556 RepID=A0A239P9S2_9ACTN|nr:lipoyl domain-containing protein [Asanoa hainanensis]SNT63139.1 Biotin-requiring enzyme [Asanoa hainanensis]
MTQVPFPALSRKDPTARGVVATWFVRDGERVEAEQVLAEVQVDKVTVEVPAPTAGVVTLLVEEGAEAAQGDVIATISRNDARPYGA